MNATCEMLTHALLDATSTEAHQLIQQPNYQAHVANCPRCGQLLHIHGALALAVPLGEPEPGFEARMVFGTRQRLRARSKQRRWLLLGGTVTLAAATVLLITVWPHSAPPATAPATAASLAPDALPPSPDSPSDDTLVETLVQWEARAAELPPLAVDTGELALYSQLVFPSE